MADHEEVEENAPHGNDWEVVSLTASTYAAAPGPKEVELNNNINEGGSGQGEAETSRALFMSGHFVFPPSQHENLPLEPDAGEICDETGCKGIISEEEEEEEEVGRPAGKDEKSWSLEGLGDAEDFPEISFLEKGEQLSSREQFEEVTALEGLSLVDQGTIYTAARYTSLHNNGALSGTTVFGEDTALTESNEPSAEVLNLIRDVSQAENVPKDDKDKFTADIPCGAWWKRSAASWYAHAKEANAFWSVFVAAAVMGLVVLGQHWQQDRWQVLQVKWQNSVNDERMSRMLRSISRLKDVIVGGDRRGSLIGSSSLNES